MGRWEDFLFSRGFFLFKNLKIFYLKIFGCIIEVTICRRELISIKDIF